MVRVPMVLVYGTEAIVVFLAGITPIYIHLFPNLECLHFHSIEFHNMIMNHTRTMHTDESLEIWMQQHAF